jgi:hypothetical protein
VLGGRTRSAQQQQQQQHHHHHHHHHHHQLIKLPPNWLAKIMAFRAVV